MNNVSLRLNSIGVFQVSKLLVTPLVVLPEYLFTGKKISWLKGGFLVMMTADMPCLANATLHLYSHKAGG